MEEFRFVFVILFGFVMPIVFFGIWTTHKKEMLKLNTKLGNSEKQNFENEITAMKKRLEVLEAIVTDSKYQLNQEINDLERRDRIN